MQLPKFITNNLPFQLMQDKWAGILNPLIANPITQGNILSAHLISGVTVINHLLSRQMKGWYIIDIDSAATIYRSKPLNDQTLTLTSNAAVNVSLAVF